MMTRKENTQFVTWWNDAFGRLVGTPTYDDICTRLKTVHGMLQNDFPIRIEIITLTHSQRLLKNQLDDYFYTQFDIVCAFQHLADKAFKLASG